METLILYPETKEQLLALKAMAKAFKIKAETSPYDPDFVSIVKNAEKRGNYAEIDPTATFHELSSSVKESRLDSAIRKLK